MPKTKKKLRTWELDGGLLTVLELNGRGKRWLKLKGEGHTGLVLSPRQSEELLQLLFAVVDKKNSKARILARFKAITTALRKVLEDL